MSFWWCIANWNQSYFTEFHYEKGEPALKLIQSNVIKFITCVTMIVVAFLLHFSLCDLEWTVIYFTTPAVRVYTCYVVKYTLSKFVVKSQTTPSHRVCSLYPRGIIQNQPGYSSVRRILRTWISTVLSQLQPQCIWAIWRSIGFRIFWCLEEY